MDWSDDISYAVHDIEDFFRVGVVPLDQLYDSDAQARKFFEYAWNRIAGKLVAHDADEAKKETVCDQTRDMFDRVRRNIFPTQPYTGSPEDREGLHRFASEVIRRAVKRIELRDTGVLTPHPDELALIEVLKQLTWYYVIDQPSLSSVQHGQAAYLENTFDKEEFAFYESDEKRNRRAVVDYIASLTDNQAIDLYGRLHGLASKSILDSWIHA
jgi:dGTPase